MLCCVLCVALCCLVMCFLCVYLLSSVPASFALVLFLGGCVAVLVVVLVLDLYVCSSLVFVFSLVVGLSFMFKRCCNLVVVLAFRLSMQCWLCFVSEFVPV